MRPMQLALLVVVFGLVLAVWSDVSKVRLQVNTGDVDMDVEDARVIGEYVGGFPEPLDLAQCRVEMRGGTATLTIDGAYRGYTCRVQLVVSSTGDVPAKPLTRSETLDLGGARCTVRRTLPGTYTITCTVLTRKDNAVYRGTLGIDYGTYTGTWRETLYVYVNIRTGTIDGCTPDFWLDRPDLWALPPNTTALIDGINMTLRDMLEDEDKRYIAAAMLNVAHPNVTYPPQLIGLVLRRPHLAAIYNDQGCPLGSNASG